MLTLYKYTSIAISLFAFSNVSARLIKLPKVEQRQDSTSKFKKRTCADVKEKKGLCKKDWIANLCPISCKTNPDSTMVDSCSDYEGKFPFRMGKKKCSYMSTRPKICKRREWIKDLCPKTCGVCKEKITTDSEREEEKDKSIGIVENNVFSTALGQPLQAKVALFSPYAIKPYENCDQFKSDLTNVASMIVNDAISDNASVDPNNHYYETREILPIQMAEATSAPNSAKGEDSYDTNTQVEGVDEADIIKSTNDTVYAAYGDKLIVWEAKTLEKLSTTIMRTEQEKTRRLSSRYFPYQRQVSIQGLLLFENRLAVIVSHDQWYHPYVSLQDRKILQNYGSITVQLYDVSNPRQLELLATKKLEGNYVDARLINNTAYVVTTAQVDTYYHLTRQFSRYTHEFLYANMTEAEYTAKATAYAKNAVIPSFVQNFMKELDIGEKCDNLMQLNMFQSFNGNQSQKIYTIPRTSMINGYTHVTGFNMNDDYTVNTNNASTETIESTSTSILLPSNYNTKIYASADKLVLATKGQEMYSNGTGWTEKTYFQVLSLSTIGIEGHSVGEVPGYLLSQYAMDLSDGHLRVATTTSAKWSCVNEDGKIVDSSVGFFQPCTRKMIVDSDNYIHVLRLPTNASNFSMKQVGRLGNLGKTGERIEAVRFMKEKAFVVTFLKTDPFYTIDLSNHTDPREVGALEITGYSNYLHPYDEEGNILIGVGQDADENGRALGLQISLFDATDLANTTLIKRYSVENEAGFNETNAWSSSAAQYDPKAFRFLPKSKKLILPMSIRDYNNPTKNFDGFTVFDLFSQDIAYSFNISHVDPKKINSFCWYNAYLSSRSLVHDGFVTTTKGHTVLVHDLDMKEMTLPPLNLDENNTECGRGGYWLG